MASIEDLYHNCSILADAKEKAGQHVKEYKVIMNGIRSGPSEKRLASQFIARFFRHFPALADDSLDAIFDLCEDEDASVRKQAIRDLPQLCRDSVEYSQRAACILLQLAAAVNATEQSAIYASLVSILRANMKGTLENIFEQMIPTEDVLRHQSILFLHAKLKVLLSDDSSKEIEEIVAQNCKKVIEEVSGDECLLLVQVLKMLPSMMALTGRQYLLDVITRHVDFNAAVKTGDVERLFHALQFIKETAGLFSKNVPSTNFVKYFCLHILPKINANDDGKDTDEMLQLLAEMVCFCADQGINNKCMASVYDALSHVIQLPLSLKEEDPHNFSETVNFPVQRLARVECILFTFHQLGRRCPQFLTAPENSATLRNLRVRLQYVSRAAQMHTKNLHSKAVDMVNSSQHSQQNKSLELMMNNINLMIKDLFHNPPSFKSAITLSFKAPQNVDKTDSSSSSEKRKFTPITFENEVEVKKTKFVHAAQQRTNASEAAQVPWQAASQRGRRGFNGFVQNRRGHLSTIQGRGRGRGFIQNLDLLQASSTQGQIPYMRGQQGQTRGTRFNTAQTTFRGQANGSKTTSVNRVHPGGQPPSLMNLRPYRGAFGRSLRGRGRAQVADMQRRVVFNENVAFHRSTPNFRLSW